MESVVVDFPERESLTKFEVAARQLQTAIRLFFNNEDPVSVHTLACASREIFEKSSGKLTKRKALDGLATIVPALLNPNIFSILNIKRNFFKHVQDNPFETIEFSDTENDLHLFMASHDCVNLMRPRQPIEAEGYLLWYLMKSTDLSFEDASLEESFSNNTKKWISLIVNEYAAVKSENRGVCKREGSKIIEDLRSGRLNR